MANSTVIVIIPIYKESPSDVEIISLKQCLKILNQHEIKFIGPTNLVTTKYKEICKSYSINFDITFYDNDYFLGINGYNKLMLSANFYKDFLDYKYLLIYQLDAYVFKDELLYWCKKDYDYIGAPHQPHQNNEGEVQFLKGYSSILGFLNGVFNTNRTISNVGNGGFSLRNTKKCYWLLKLSKKAIAKWGSNNEDGFFKYWGNLLSPIFKLPKDKTAIYFSIEDSPAASLSAMNGSLPFGCHAFEKNEPETWQKYIKFKKE